jgi:hypothetical protein
MANDMLILQPLATTRYVFERGYVTGDMKTPGISMAYYEVEKQQWSGGGVLTRQQVIVLRDFLDTYLTSDDSRTSA